MIDCLSRCADGDLPANVALMQLCLDAYDEQQARHGLARALAEAVGDPARLARLTAVQRLWQGTPQAYPTIQAIDRAARISSAPSPLPTPRGDREATTVEDADHEADRSEPVEQVSAIAALFDRAAQISPIAGVALYSLGDPGLLDAATQEIVARIGEWRLVGAGARVLDLGCGSGRMLRGLAPVVATIVGLDVSTAMVQAARAGTAAWPNVSVLQVPGRNLADVPGGPFDLVIAIDSFPYLVAAGLAARHVAECHRVLRPMGHLLIMNFSYGGSVDDDRASVRHLAAGCGFTILRDGTRDLRLWDGTTYLLRRGA